MHSHAKLIQTLYESLDKHDHEAMASCYHPDATFEDIAFKLGGIKQIHAMWAMICRPEPEIKVTIIKDSIHADNGTGEAKVVDVYKMSNGNIVRNEIHSHFQFREGLIFSHRDVCDPEEWARQAIGGAIGKLAGKSRFLRSLMAKLKLWVFTMKNPKFA